MNLSSWTWNWNFFGVAGYVGVGIAVFVLFFWLIHFAFKAKPFVCHLALVLAVAAFVLAKYNSLTHVNRIRLDPAAQEAAFEAQQEAKRRAFLDSRGEGVADIQFAEDSSDERLDFAGMDETDLKYLEKLENAEPEWKKEKKTRSGTESGSGGMESEELEKAAEAEPILMADAEMVMANQFDAWVLRATRWLILLGIVIVVFDHLRRANIYRDAYFPRPIPSSMLNSLTPHPPVVVRPARPRRKMPGELAWLLKRGDSFVYLTDDPAAADLALRKLRAFEKRRRRPVEILRASDDSGGETPEFSDDFAFECWWHGRASIVIDNADRAVRLAERFLVLLEQRNESRARVAQTAHLVWDLDTPMPPASRTAFEWLARRTGVSLFLNRNPEPAASKSSQPL